MNDAALNTEPAPADGVRPYRIFDDGDLDEIVASVFHEECGDR